MLKFRHVYKTYVGPVHALRDVSFSVEKGEFVFITGPSGSGKTTLFKLLTSLDQPTSGEIQCLGFDLGQIKQKEKPLYRQKIGVVYQDFKLLPQKTVFENVVLPLLIRQERSQNLDKKVAHALKAVGLSNRADSHPLSLSGGEQQRVAIARALIHQPGLLIADEPTGNLDPALSQEIFDLFEKVCAQGTTVLLATHDLVTVEKRKKRVLQLNSGQLKDSISNSITQDHF